MKALVGAFSQKKALVWAFSVIVKTDVSKCVSKWPWIIVYWSFIISIPRVKIDHCTIMDGDCLSVHFQLRQHHGIVFKLSF